MNASRKLGILLVFLLLLPSLPASLGSENVVLRITSNPSGASGYIEGLNVSFVTPATVEVPEGNWVMRVTNGKYTVVYNLSARGKLMKVFVDFTNLRQSIKGPFVNATVEYGFNITVPTREDEYVPPMAAPIWDEEVCGGIIMFGPREPPMLIYKYSLKDPYYQLFLNSTPSIEEYRGRKGCKMMETIYYLGNDSAMARSIPYREASFIAPHALLSIDSEPENATVYIFDFHRFGEWFTPFDVLVPVIPTERRNVSVVHYDFESRSLTTTIIPMIPELHTYRLGIGSNGYPFLEGWVELKPEGNYSVSVDLELLKFALRVNGEPPTEHASKREHLPVYVPNTTLLIVSSTPSAELFVDGRFMGKTPVAEEVAGGEHEIALKINGREVWKKRIDVGYGGRFRLTVFLEEYLKGHGRIKTR
ncbi:PEGA domain-containing protein [Palaeococcus ferrophilus]|uniref:PEGA domain-containing protein n=1 Tax=Palaeococcus ferrophilus TaxID=83868 RepID=UPI00064EB12F|nr:PEGA domain-containing protein [Palaeococcus ferrophilus]